MSLAILDTGFRRYDVDWDNAKKTLWRNSLELLTS
jgi:hypothetical protein